MFGLNHFLELSYLVNTGSVLQFSQFSLCHPLVGISELYTCMYASEDEVNSKFLALGSKNTKSFVNLKT